MSTQHSTACLRCGSTEDAPLNVEVIEAYVYSAAITRREHSMDISTSYDGRVHGRICAACTPDVLRSISPSADRTA